MKILFTDFLRIAISRFFLLFHFCLTWGPCRNETWRTLLQSYCTFSPRSLACHIPCGDPYPTVCGDFFVNFIFTIELCGEICKKSTVKNLMSCEGIVWARLSCMWMSSYHMSNFNCLSSVEDFKGNIGMVTHGHTITHVPLTVHLKQFGISKILNPKKCKNCSSRNKTTILLHTI